MKTIQFPQASYCTCGLPQYDGNPLIEALPPILSDHKIGELLKREVPYEDKQRLLPAEVRRHALDAISTVFVPLPQHFHLVHTVSKVIRTGYTSRNPMNPRFWANIPGQRTDLTARLTGIEQAPENTLGMAIVGPSGTGKTYSINRILRLLHQVIQHTHYKGQAMSLTQLTWLKLDCPFDGSIKGLATKFFAAIDRILSTPYQRIYENSRRTVDQMTVKRKAAQAGLKFPRQAVRPTRKKPVVHSGQSKSRLQYHRRRWEKALRCEKPVRQLLPSTYSHLFRFDREWLDENRPPKLKPC
jgi:hypothetical protein